jgi:hypothetical protein
VIGLSREQHQRKVRKVLRKVGRAALAVAAFGTTFETIETMLIIGLIVVSVTLGRDHPQEVRHDPVGQTTPVHPPHGP